MDALSTLFIVCTSPLIMFCIVALVIQGIEKQRGYL